MFIPGLLLRGGCRVEWWDEGNGGEEEEEVGWGGLRGGKEGVGELV